MQIEQVGNITELTLEKDLKTYLHTVGPFLEHSEAENGLFLGVMNSLVSSSAESAPFMVHAKGERGVVFAGFYLDTNLLLSQGPESFIKPLAEKLFAQRIEIPGVVGPAKVSEAFAKNWAQLRGCGYSLVMEQLIYKLEKVVCPTGIPGQMRKVAPGDKSLLADWIMGFYQDALPHEMITLEGCREVAQLRIAKGMTYIWEVDGTPVTMTALSRPTRRGISINAVYTPPEHRKRGYASGLVAAVSEVGLKQGKEFCTLYTDLNNPTSNSIYQRIGYQAVSASRHYQFSYS